VTGLVETPQSFTLAELRSLELIELPLTVECIGNSRNGSLVSTAEWTGFSLYDFLDALGLDEQATGVRYMAADGYYASHTLEQIQDNQVMGALFMNAEVIPPIHCFHGDRRPAVSTISTVLIYFRLYIVVNIRCPAMYRIDAWFSKDHGSLPEYPDIVCIHTFYNF